MRLADPQCHYCTKFQVSLIYCSVMQVADLTTLLQAVPAGQVALPILPQPYPPVNSPLPPLAGIHHTWNGLGISSDPRWPHAGKPLYESTTGYQPGSAS